MLTIRDHRDLAVSLDLDLATDENVSSCQDVSDRVGRDLLG